jgi:hypothetical protein
MFPVLKVPQAPLDTLCVVGVPPCGEPQGNVLVAQTVTATVGASPVAVAALPLKFAEWPVPLLPVMVRLAELGATLSTVTGVPLTAPVVFPALSVAVTV